MKTMASLWQRGSLYKPFGLRHRFEQTWLKWFLSSGPSKGTWSSHWPLNHPNSHLLEFNWGMGVQLDSILGIWIQWFFVFVFFSISEASFSLAQGNYIINRLGLLLLFSFLFAFYSMNFVLGYMRNVATRILKCLFITNQKPWLLNITVSATSCKTSFWNSKLKRVLLLSLVVST